MIVDIAPKALLAESAEGGNCARVKNHTIPSEKRHSTWIQL